MKAIDGTLLTDSEYDLLLSLSDEGHIEPGELPSFKGSWFQIANESELEEIQKLLNKGLAILDGDDAAFALTKSGVVLANAIAQREGGTP